MRIAAALIGAQADRLQQGCRHGVALPSLAEAMDIIGLADLFEDGEAPVERPKRVLVDHLHARPHLAPGQRAGRRDRRTLEQHIAVVRRLQPEREPPGRRLARAGFADQAKRPATLHRQRDAVDGANLDRSTKQALPHGIATCDASHLKQRGSVHA